METKRFTLFLAFVLMSALGLEVSAQVSGQVVDIYMNRYNSATNGDKLPVEDGEILGTIHWRGWTPAGEYQSSTAIRTYVTGNPDAGYLPGRMVFYTGGSDLFSHERMTILENGNVGIGISDPQATLHVAGDFILDGDFTVNGDLTAENVKANQNVEAGVDVVAGNNVSAGNDVMATNNVTAGGDVSGTNLNASNDVSAGNDVMATNNVTAGGDVSGTNLNASNDVSAGNDVMATNNVTAGGDVSGTNVHANNDVTAGGNIVADQDLGAGNDVTAINNVNAGQDVVAGNNVSALNDVIAGNDVSASNNVVAGQNVFADNDIKATNNLQAGQDVKAGNNVVAEVDLVAGNDVEAGNDVRVGNDLHVSNDGFIDGRLAIGIANDNRPDGYRLYVADGILAEKVKVALKDSDDWADYVFDEDYVLMPLSQVEAFIRQNKHLPGVPSAQQVQQQGIDVAKMDALLLQKIEELTLYMLELKKENEAMRKELDELKKAKTNR